MIHPEVDQLLLIIFPQKAKDNETFLLLLKALLQ